MSRVMLIFNPMADHARSGQKASDLRAIVEEMGGADWRGTEYPAHGTEIAAHAADEGYEVVAALGGDGTVHEVVNGLMRIPIERRPRLGLVPIGSGNDFAHAVGVQSNPQEAMKRVFSGTPRAADAALMRDGSGRGEYFVNTAGIGFDGAVNIRTRKLKLVNGFMMYLTATLQSIALNFDPLPMKVVYDEGTIERPLQMLTVGNGPREGGGFVTTPDSKIDDGLLDFVYFDRMSQFRMLQMLPKVLKAAHVREHDVHVARTRRLVIDSERALPIHMDGELFAPYEADVRHVEVEVCPGALQVMT